MADEPGRAAQRRRTRRAIVDATAELVAKGTTPTIADIAAAADVSRRTVYMYFPTLEHLLVDATLGALSQAQVDRAIEVAGREDDPGARVEALARAMQSMSPDVERLGRSLIRLTVESPPSAPGPDSPDASGPDNPRRGYRRVEWIMAALEPLRSRLGTVPFERLVHALTMVMGWEALIVQRDVCGLDAQQGEELSVWAARALVTVALAESSAPKG